MILKLLAGYEFVMLSIYSHDTFEHNH